MTPVRESVVFHLEHEMKRLLVDIMENNPLKAEVDARFQCIIAECLEVDSKIKSEEATLLSKAYEEVVKERELLRTQLNILTEYILMKQREEED